MRDEVVPNRSNGHERNFIRRRGGEEVKKNEQEEDEWKEGQDSHTNIRIASHKTKAAPIAGCGEPETGVATRRRPLKRKRRSGRREEEREETEDYRWKKKNNKKNERKMRRNKVRGEEATGEKKVEKEKKETAFSLAAGLSRRSRPSSICITGIYRQRGPAWRQTRACPRYVISLDSSSRDGLRISRGNEEIERDGSSTGGDCDALG